MKINKKEMLEEIEQHLSLVAQTVGYWEDNEMDNQIQQSRNRWLAIYRLVKKSRIKNIRLNIYEPES